MRLNYVDCLSIRCHILIKFKYAAKLSEAQLLWAKICDISFFHQSAAQCRPVTKGQTNTGIEKPLI